MTSDRTPRPTDGLIFPGAERAPQGRAVLLVTVGTTAAELPLLVRALSLHERELMPFGFLVFDSLAHEDLVARHVQNGWSEAEVLEAIPRSRYLRLTSPLDESFDFEAPLNRDYQQTVHEPAMRPRAVRPDSPGCGGEPFNGRLVVEANEQSCWEAFRRGCHELTSAGSAETVALLPGIEIRFVTTWRGGTGTGAIQPLAALARSAAPDKSRLHLQVLMPCIYGGDLKSHAAAYAALLECQEWHSLGKGVPLKGGRTLPAPFAAVTYTFASNGTVSLGPKDALREAAEVLRCYLRPQTQSAINTRHVDLRDATPFDLEDKPTHIRQQTATAVATIAPDVHHYLGAEILRQACSDATERFESWCVDATLTVEETPLVQQTATRTVEHERLTLPALLERLDGSPRPETTLLAFFEQTQNEVGGLRADAVKALMQELPGKARALCVRLEQALAAAAEALPGALAPALVTGLLRAFAGREHLALAGIEPLSRHLEQVKAEAEARAEEQKKSRENLNLEVGTALGDVQAVGRFTLFNRDRVTRDAAGRALDLLYRASLARVQQLRCELLARSLERVLAALGDARTNEEVALRRQHAARSAELRTQLEVLGRRLESYSPRFQRFLLFDGVTPAALETEARKLRPRLSDVPALRAYLEGHAALEPTLREVLALLPAWAESQKSLTELVLGDPARRRQLVQLLRSVAPFTAIDRVVEEQQGLAHRRDSLKVLELPGGKDGPLAEVALSEGIVDSPDSIVESSGDAIRIFLLRDGLPYAALQDAKTYKALFDRYRADPAAISPFTIAGAHRFARIEAPRTNLRLHTQGVLWEAKAILEDRVQELRGTGFLLRYPSERGTSGFIVTLEERFPDFDELVRWVAKNPPVRKALEKELHAAFARPDACVAGLLSAWHRAQGGEREHLEDVLAELRIDPRKELAAHAAPAFLA